MARALAHSEKARRALASRKAAAPAKGAVPVVATVGPDARLELLEFLLGTLNVETCAQESLRWLARELGVAQAMCLVFDEPKKRLVHLAEVGVDAADFAISFADEEGHPLLVALSSRAPTFFPASPRQPLTPLGRRPFHAIVLRSAQIRGAAAGMLLVETSGPELPADIAWFGEVFGEQIARLQSRLFPGEGGRERLFLHSVLDAVSDPILLTDGSGNLILANARAEKLFTATDESNEGRRRAITLNNMLFSSALAGASFEETSERRTELTLIDPSDGSDLLFELLTSPARDLGSGDGSGVVSVLRNITDLGRAAEEIKESYRELRSAKEDLVTERHRLDLIIDSVADPIVVTDAAGDVLLMNTPAERLFTVPKGKGTAAQRLVRSNDVNFSSFVSNLFFTQAALRHRGDMVLLDPVTGDPLPFEAVAGKVITEQGELTAIVTTLHDRREAIERARLYAQVEQAKNELEGRVLAATGELAQQNELLRRQAIELEQASNLKSQFLANMSHELRTPLNAILGYTHMLLNKVYGIPSPPQQKSLQRVDSNARHLMSIINEILDIARIESGKMPVHLDDVKLDALVKEVLQELDPIVTRTKLTVTSQVGRLPVLKTDRQKVKQIVVNLLSNALKFTHKGTVSITATWDPKTSTAKIAVADSGIGIAEADFRKVFEDFRQVDNSPTREYGGTGLGLAICRRFAQMLGGRITLESKLGVGSTFTLHLPQDAPRQ